MCRTLQTSNKSHHKSFIQVPVRPFLEAGIKGNPSAMVTLTGESKVARVYKYNFSGRAPLLFGTTLAVHALVNLLNN